MHCAGDSKGRQTQILDCCKGCTGDHAKAAGAKERPAETHYESQFEAHTKDGKRVLALGYRYLGDEVSRSECNSLKREDVEKDLICPSFLVMTSPLKRRPSRR